MAEAKIEAIEKKISSFLQMKEALAKILVESIFIGFVKNIEKLKKRLDSVLRCRIYIYK